MVFSGTGSRDAIVEPIIRQLLSQRPDTEKAKIVSVSGAVKFPGTYPLVNSMSPKQLISAAGGLKESAYTTVAEITRRDFTDPENATIRHLNV